MKRFKEYVQEKIGHSDVITPSGKRSSAMFSGSMAGIEQDEFGNTYHVNKVAGGPMTSTPSKHASMTDTSTADRINKNSLKSLRAVQK